MPQATDNPLLQAHVLPPFGQIRPEHMVPAVKVLTQENQAALEEQLAQLGEPTWENLVAPLEEREDRLNQAWAPISHLNGVANSPEIREAYNQCIAILTEYNTAFGQNQKLFAAYQSLAQSPQFKTLNQAQQQAVNNALRDFKLAGVDLDGDRRTRYGAIKSKLSALSNTFSNNVLDATQGWFKHITNAEQLAGMPDSAIAAAAQAAKNKELEGWVLTLDGPVYLTVMTQADDRQLRQEMYSAYMTRASDQGPNAGQWDNQAVIDEIVTLRMELAKLLGFTNYAELSLAPKMADSPQQVLSFLRDLARHSKPVAAQELQDLQEWSRARYGVEDLAVWDVPYYAEKMKEDRFNISQEKLRPYFPQPHVVQGLFDVVEQLFQVTIKPEENDEVWHPDVQFFTIERNGEPLASFYLDLYAREGKRGGAWMAECRVRRTTQAGTQRPVAFLVCNFSAPVADQPALLTHDEVTTLFHEFGHGLHHMLTQIDVAAVSGINGVAWDAVELPSQFMENWAWEKSVLENFSSHFQTGEKLPEAWIDSLLAAKTYQAAMAMVRQIEFSMFDFRLHMEFGNPEFPGVQTFLEQVRKEVAVLQPPSFNRFQNGFSHIFAGGYAAGYYSYKWAEVLSADAFAAFEEEGLFHQQTGQRFLTEILQQGGAQDAMTLFKNFRGREPSVDALLRHAGIRA